MADEPERRPIAALCCARLLLPLLRPLARLICHKAGVTGYRYHGYRPCPASKGQGLISLRPPTHSVSTGNRQLVPSSDRCRLAMPTPLEINRGNLLLHRFTQTRTSTVANCLTLCRRAPPQRCVRCKRSSTQRASDTPSSTMPATKQYVASVMPRGRHGVPATRRAVRCQRFAPAVQVTNVRGVPLGS